MTALLGRQGELVAQFRELLTFPSPPATLESAVRPPPPPATPSRRSSKRGRGDEVTNGRKHHGEYPAATAAAAAAAAARPRRHSCKRRRKKQQSGTSMAVTSAPDLFDGYQWRKYGKKLIEGAMYPRSYYRCTRSAEQGCAAKRTVQRNDDDGAATAAGTPMYTVVRVGEHSCTANDSTEAPVILETTAAAGGVFLRPDTATSSNNNSTTSTITTTATVGTESPVISDNTWNTITSSVVSDCYIDNGLFAAVHDNDWVPALDAQSPSSFPRIEDFTGPIRSPVHISATTADGWTIDLDPLLLQLLQQLVNEPTICQHLEV